MSTASSSFQTPCRITANTGLPGFLSCSNDLIGQRLGKKSGVRAVAKVKEATLNANPFNMTRGVRASKMQIDYSTGQKRLGGSSIAKSISKLTPPPHLPCGQANKTPIPTSYEKSILPCEPEYHSVAVPNVMNQVKNRLVVDPKNNTLILKPFPNSLLATSVTVMGKRRIPKTNERYKRVFTGGQSTHISYAAHPVTFATESDKDPKND